MIGKIILYDKYSGYILGIDGKRYIFNYNDVNDKINSGDYVSFTPEQFDKTEYKKVVARNISKATVEELINQKNNNNIEKGI